MAPIPLAVQNFQSTGSTASIGFGFSSSKPSFNGLGAIGSETGSIGEIQGGTEIANNFSKTSSSNSQNITSSRNTDSGGFGCPEGSCDDNRIQLDEVVISASGGGGSSSGAGSSSSSGPNGPGVNDVGWFLSTAANGVYNTADYNSKYYQARYGTRELTKQQITQQIRNNQATIARNAKVGGIATTVLFGAYDIGNGYIQDGGQIGQNTKAAALRTGGAAAGAWAGGKLGGAIGTAICGPLCGVAGAIIGGAYLGYQGGKADNLID